MCGKYTDHQSGKCPELPCAKAHRITVGKCVYCERDELAKILSWLESQECWIGLEGEFDVRPKITAGGKSYGSIRDAYKKAMLK